MALRSTVEVGADWTRRFAALKQPWEERVKALVACAERTPLAQAVESSTDSVRVVSRTAYDLPNDSYLGPLSICMLADGAVIVTVWEDSWDPDPPSVEGKNPDDRFIATQRVTGRKDSVVIESYRYDAKQWESSVVVQNCQPVKDFTAAQGGAEFATLLMRGFGMKPANGKTWKQLLTKLNLGDTALNHMVVWDVGKAESRHGSGEPCWDCLQFECQCEE